MRGKISRGLNNGTDSGRAYTNSNLRGGIMESKDRRLHHKPARQPDERLGTDTGIVMRHTDHIYKWHWTAAFGLPFVVLLLLLAWVLASNGQRFLALIAGQQTQIQTYVVA